MIKFYHKGFPAVDLSSLAAFASQSSVHSSGVASKAVEGDASGMWISSSCSHTSSIIDPSEPWWQIELQDTYAISEVWIRNRDDPCCSKIHYSTICHVITGYTICATGIIGGSYALQPGCQYSENGISIYIYLIANILLSINTIRLQK